MVDLCRDCDIECTGETCKFNNTHHLAGTDCFVPKVNKKKRLLDLVSAFVDLKEDDYATDGWDDVDVSDMTVLAEIIQEIISQRFRKDVDGYLPVEYQLVNRNVQEFILYGNAMKYEATPREAYKLTSAARVVAGYAENATLKVMLGDDDE